MKLTIPFASASLAALAWAGISISLAQNPATPNAGATANGAAEAESSASDFPPKRFDPRRYDAIFQRNPFMQEVVAEDKPVEEDPWADDLILRAVTRIGGRYVVHVENTKLVGDQDPEQRKLAHHRLVEGSNSGKLRIQSVKPHRDPSQVEVVLATGSGAAVKTATVQYSEKQLAAKTPTPRPTGNTKGKATTTRRPVPTTTRTTTTPTTKRSTTPGKRRVILPPGLQGK